MSNGIPRHGAGFLHLIEQSFPDPDRSGVTVRELTPPGGPAVTIAFMPDLLGRGDLQALVLGPLAAGLPDAPPEDLVRLALFPATVLKVVGDAAALERGLLAGQVALHLEGHEGALLLGAGGPSTSAESFGSDLPANVALLRRCVKSPALQVERIAGTDGCEHVLLYLEGSADAAHVQGAREWAAAIGPQPSQLPWWRVLAQPFLLPATLPCSTPVATAEHLRRGHVAVMPDHRREAMVGPLTLDLLFRGCYDFNLAEGARRVVVWPRVVAAILSTTIGAGFVAIASYHHSLFPTPFLIALASGRQNLPFPIFFEILLAEFIGDAMRSAAFRVAGRRWGVLAALGTALVTLAALAGGILAPVSVIIGNLSTLFTLAAPNQALARLTRFWRFLFTLAAVGLGMFGLTLLFFVLMAHLANTAAFGHPAREPLRGRSIEG